MILFNNVKDILRRNNISPDVCVNIGTMAVGMSGDHDLSIADCTSVVDVDVRMENVCIYANQKIFAQSLFDH